MESSSSQPILIPIERLVKGDDKDGVDTIPEYAMLELNGELLPPKKIALTDALDDKENPTPNLIPPDHFELGSLTFKDNVPILICGSHELKGRAEILKQPFCVLRKQHPVHSTDDNDSITTSYSIEGVVTRKYLFNQYPKSILR